MLLGGAPASTWSPGASPAEACCTDDEDDAGLGILLELVSTTLIGDSL